MCTLSKPRKGRKGTSAIKKHPLKKKQVVLESIPQYRNPIGHCLKNSFGNQKRSLRESIAHHRPIGPWLVAPRGTLSEYAMVDQRNQQTEERERENCWICIC